MIVGLTGELTAAAALEAAGELHRHWAARGHRSHDPYDGLAARFVPAAAKQHRLPRLALVHLHKRSPVNLRPLFGVPTTRNAYAAGHFASANLIMAALTGTSEPREAADDHLGWLRSVSIRGGWAYPFDVQTRTFHYLRTTPNVICTVFAANAFLDAADREGDDAALRTATDAAEFMVRELLTGAGGERYFKYLPDEDALIHNANVLAAQVLVRCGRLSGEERLVDIGREVLAPTLAAVRNDGSLLYGRGPDLDWVDGHHTGFVVEGLLDIARRCSDADLMAVVDHMAAYYRDHLFTAAGEPQQRPGVRYPVDVIAGAQGIQTFARLGGEYRATAIAVAAFMMANMRLPSGTFAFQRYQRHWKKVPYARWSDAPMCLALAVLAASLAPGQADA
jgi:polysaccharide biosynthesis protein VpsJ